MPDGPAVHAAGISRLNVASIRLIRRVLPPLPGATSSFKINMVADTNDAEIDAMVAFCIEQHFILRLIEVMPVGEAGRSATVVDPAQATATHLRRAAGAGDALHVLDRRVGRHGDGERK